MKPQTILKPADQLSAFLDWLLQIRVDRYDLAVIRFGKNNPEGIFIPGSTNVDHQKLQASLAWLKYENSQTSGVYFRPARGYAWPLVFLDDVTPTKAYRLADTHNAALIETSPSKYHVWLGLDQPLDEHDRYRAQSELAKKIGADMGSVSGEHWGRLPGFKNRKPGKDNWVNLRRLTSVQPYPATAHVVGEIKQDVEKTTRKTQATQTDEQDASEVEWKFVRSALEAGVAPSIVYQRLLEHCASRRGSDAKRYADLTLRKACEKGGIAY